MASKKRPAAAGNHVTATGESAGSERGADADEAPPRGSDEGEARDRSSATLSKRPRTALAAAQENKVWRPKSQHRMAPNQKCWSCVAGGFAAHSSVGRDDTCNCCRACCTDRSCAVCHTFNDDLHAPWCSKCESRVALWCATCDGSKLADGLCRHCSETCQHKRMLELPAELQTGCRRLKPSDFCKNGCLARSGRPRRSVRQGFCKNCYEQQAAVPLLANTTCVLCGPSKGSKRKCPVTGKHLCGMCLRDMCPELLAKAAEGDKMAVFSGARRC